MFGISKYSINTYFAMLVVTVIASGAALLIVRMGTTAHASLVHGDDEAQFAELRESILKSR